MQAAAGELDQIVYQDHALFWLRTHTDFLETGIRLLADTIQRPCFADESLERIRQIVLRELHQHSLDSLHGLSLGLMSPDLPRRMSAPGELECVEAFDIEAVRRHFAQFYVPANMTLVFAGRFDAERAAEVTADAFEEQHHGVMAVVY